MGISLDDFRKIHQAVLLTRPMQIDSTPPDPVATKEQLEMVEHELQLKIPNLYRAFLENFGGGEFGSTVIYSAHSTGNWYLPKMQREAMEYIPVGFLAFSEDFCGGYFLLSTTDAACEKVFYYDTNGYVIENTEFESILDHIVEYAY